MNVAAPPALVFTVSVPPSVPPAGPDASAAVTAVPDCATAFPAASRTWITGCCGIGVPLCAPADGCVVMPSWVAVPAVSVMVAEIAAVSPDEEKVRVYGPTVPVRPRPLKVAAPLALVGMGVVPHSEPPQAVTLTH